MKAPNAGPIKLTACNIPYNPAWQQLKQEVMQDIFTTKKDQVEGFRVELAKTGQEELAGDALWDYFWGTCLSLE